MHKYDVWSAGVARKSLKSTRTGNPTLAATSLLGKGTVRRAARAAVGRRGRRAFRGNPLPAVAGILGSGLLGKFSKSFDPKKHAVRVARVRGMAEAALKGDKTARTGLEGIAQGREGFGVAIYPEIVQEAATLLEQLLAVEQKQAEAVVEQKAAHREAAAASATREARFLEAGTSIGSALASSLGRSRRQPTRRRRPSRRGQYY